MLSDTNDLAEKTLAISQNDHVSVNLCLCLFRVLDSKIRIFIDDFFPTLLHKSKIIPIVEL